MNSDTQLLFFSQSRQALKVRGQSVLRLCTASRSLDSSEDFIMKMLQPVKVEVHRDADLQRKTQFFQGLEPMACQVLHLRSHG